MTYRPIEAIYLRDARSNDVLAWRFVEGYSEGCGRWCTPWGEKFDALTEDALDEAACGVRRMVELPGQPPREVRLTVKFRA